MTHADRARLALARCNRKAEVAQQKALNARYPDTIAGYAELSEQYRKSADEWEQVLRNLDESTEGCPECGSALDTPCGDECDCHPCEADRAADAFADAWT